MAEFQRPVFVCAENPEMTLCSPGTDRTVAVASYWHCVVSPWGVGRALVLWLRSRASGTKVDTRGGIYAYNLDMARGLVNSLIQYFPAFRGVPLEDLPYAEAVCSHSFDGHRYQVECRAEKTRIELEWAKILDWKRLVWLRFPTGPVAYDLATLICPCREAQALVDGVPIDGEAQIGQTSEGTTGSSAFLAFAETWIGPVAQAGDESAQISQ
jgi:hypothetical protein